MTCKQIRKLLIEDLVLGARSSVRIHLKNCPECCQFQEELQALEDLSQTLSSGKGAPQGFSGEVFKQTASVTPISFRVRNAAAVSVLSLSVLLVVSLWPLSDDGAAPEMRIGSENSRPSPLGPASFKPMQARSAADEFGVSIRPLSRPTSSDIDRGDFIDVVIKEPGKPDQILRLPATIQIKKKDLPRDAYVSRVSY